MQPGRSDLRQQFGVGDGEPKSVLGRSPDRALFDPDGSTPSGPDAAAAAKSVPKLVTRFCGIEECRAGWS
jgi:hypothetical protein